MLLFGEWVFVDFLVVFVGDIEIGVDSLVWLLVVICGDMYCICIGQCSSIQDGSVLYIIYVGFFNLDGFLLSIGDEVIVGYKVLLYGCSIGNWVLVGMGLIVMDGVVIED